MNDSRYKNLGQLPYKTRLTILMGIILLFFLIIYATWTNSNKKGIYIFDLSEKIALINEDHRYLRTYATNLLTTDPLYSSKQFKQNPVDLIAEMNSRFDQCIFTIERLDLSDEVNLSEHLDSLSTLFMIHKNTFGELIEKTHARGNGQSGLIGQWHEITGDCLALIMNIDQPHVNELGLSLVEIEKKYMSTGLSIYPKQAISRVDAIINELAPVNMAYSRLAGLLHDMKVVLNELLVIDKALGYHSGGIIETYLQTDKLIEGQISEIANKIGVYQESYARGTGIKALVIIFIFSFIIIYFLYQTTSSLNRDAAGIMGFVKTLLTGKFPEKLPANEQHELSSIAGSLNSLADDLKQKAVYTDSLGKGKLQSNYTPLSKNDALGNALVKLEVSMLAAVEEKERHASEEKKRNWINEGLAGFSDILRENNDDIKQLSDKIIQKLVSYVNAIQGGLFLLKNEDTDNPFLELVSAFAYDRKKYIKKTVQLGEGLVGTCALEKETIFLTEVPPEYVTITSGLGEAPPNCLIIVPLKTEEELLGIIEIATLNKFQKHEIEFIEKIAYSITSALSMVKINERTTELLKQSQKQAQELSEQEEEMRQNMEELRATQEQSAQNEAETQGILNAIDMSAIIIEVDLRGNILKANKNFLNIFAIAEKDVVGKNISSISGGEMSLLEWESIWEKLEKGENESITGKIILNNKICWLSHHFTPVMVKGEKAVKIIDIAIDNTKNKELELTLNKKTVDKEKHIKGILDTIESIDKALVRCVFDNGGCFVEVNTNFSMITGYHSKELMGKDARNFMDKNQIGFFNKIIDKLHDGELIQEDFSIAMKNGGVLNIKSTFIPSVDAGGALKKVDLISNYNA